MKLLPNQILVPVKTMPSGARRDRALAPHPVGGRGTIDGGLGGAPIALGGGVTNLAKGLSAPIDETQLGLGFRSAYYIDEIRISAYTAAVASSTNYSALAAFVNVAFQAGPHAFASHFPNGIPMWLLGQRLSIVDSGSAPANNAGNQNRYFSRVRWFLPKPLYMPPGDVLRCTVFHTANPQLYTMPNINVNVTYVGRAIAQGAPPPLTRQVPWLAYMQSYFPLSTVTKSPSQSTDQFRNTFTKRVIVHKLTGRVVRGFDAGGGANPVLSDDEASLPGTVTLPLPVGGVYFDTRIDDSLGYGIVPQYAPFGAVYDSMERGGWTFSRALGPKEQFNIQVRNNGATPVDTSYVTQVGMVGYRDEEI